MRNTDGSWTENKQSQWKNVSALAKLVLQARCILEKPVSAQLVWSCTLGVISHKIVWVVPHENIYKRSELSLFLLCLSLCLNTAFEQACGCIPLHPDGRTGVGTVNKVAKKGLSVIQSSSCQDYSERFNNFLRWIQLEEEHKPDQFGKSLWCSLCSKLPSSAGMRANTSSPPTGLPHTQLPFRRLCQESRAERTAGDVERREKKKKKKKDLDAIINECASSTGS